MNSFDITHFNPGSQREADFLAGFIARQNELQYFLALLRNTNDLQAAKHHIIIAPRGYGKTTLLRRISIALRDETEFRKRYIPLAFREEQHNVISLDVFWRNCLQALLEEREDEKAPSTELDELDQLWHDYPPRSNIKRELQDGKPAWTAFNDYCLKLGRRPVLLIDNLDALLAGLGQHQWGLRSILQEPGGPILIAAASQYPDSLSDSRSAFYDFFRITTLPRLSDQEVMTCLRELAMKRGERGSSVRQMLDTDPGRISALNTMAGGNPRTLGVLYMVLEAHMSDDVLAQLSAMLDTFTGWYQARAEELPLQSRAVFDALALNWDPMTAASIGEVTGLDTPTVSSHLNRLAKSGYIETVLLSKTKKSRNGYQVSERFFNIWYLMRNGPRRTRQSIYFLTKFLSSCFSKKELQEMARDKLRNGVGRVESMLALAASISNARLRTRLLDYAESTLSQNAREGDLRSVVNEMRVQYGKEVKPNSGGLDKYFDKFVNKYRNYVNSGRYKEAEYICRKEINKDNKNGALWIMLGRLLEEHLERYEDAEEAYRKAIKSDDKHMHPWILLGILLEGHLERYEDAEEAYRKAIELNGKDARPWGLLGILFENKLKRYEDAEEAYRKAIELNGKDMALWMMLGHLLEEHLERYEDAEEAYRKAIKTDDKDMRPWVALACLLEEHLERYEDAEEAYRKAIERNRKDADIWMALGQLLEKHLKRYKDAEIAYREAIELDGKDASQWGLLGLLLEKHLKRYEDAEVAYRKAIELGGEDQDMRPWMILGHLLEKHLGRYEDAEAAYHKAIELDDKNARPWMILGRLLEKHLGRYEDAEAAYRKSIELDGKDARLWMILGNLLESHLARYEEAEAIYRKAIGLNGEDALLWIMLGRLLEDHLKRYEDAEVAYRKSVGLNSKNENLWMILGLFLEQRLERYEEAEIAYRKAIELNNKNADQWMILADLLRRRLERYEEAEVAYRRALELGEQDESAWVGLGNVLQDFVGKYEEAMAVYKQGLVYYPDSDILLVNISYLCAFHLGALEAANSYANQINSGLSESGNSLLQSALAWSDGQADSAIRGWNKLHHAVACEDGLLWTSYIDDLQRILVYATVKGDGKLIRSWMEEANYPVKYAPLYHAYRAVLDGEDHLLKVNPEVRGMAENIYRGLARMLVLFNRGR